MQHLILKPHVPRGKTDNSIKSGNSNGYNLIQSEKKDDIFREMVKGCYSLQKHTTRDIAQQEAEFC
jgi:hypothetical protein